MEVRRSVGGRGGDGRGGGAGEISCCCLLWMGTSIWVETSLEDREEEEGGWLVRGSGEKSKRSSNVTEFLPISIEGLSDLLQ